MIPPVPTSDPMRSPTPASPGRCPSWRAAALLALVAGVSSGITLAVVGTGDDHNASSSTDEPSVWQDTRTYPDDAQNSESTPSPSPVAKSYGMGEKAKNGGATVVVKKVSESATLAIDRYGEAKTLKAGTGAKYVVVETTVYNDGTASFDPVCGGGISRGLVDADGRTFDATQDQYMVRGNDKACGGEEMQPGFKQDAVFVYKLPAEAIPAQWAFSGTRENIEDEPAVVKIASTSTS